VNGRNINFSYNYGSCGGYIAIYPNFCENAPASTPLGAVTDPTYNEVFAALRQVPSGRVIPGDYFTFSELNFGGHELHTQFGTLQSDNQQYVTKRQVGGGPANSRVIAITIGFR